MVTQPLVEVPPAARRGLIGSGTERGEVVRAVVIAGIAACAILLLAPPPGDASAHLYRTWLVEHGVFFWDNHWFAGSYPIITYSPLYYVLAALVGGATLTVLGVLVTAACFAALTVREWGSAGVWPARCFGLCAAGPLITGTAPYGLGLAAALACLLALQRGRRSLAFALAAATVAFSALAFVFLGLTLAAVALSGTPARRRRSVEVGAGMAALAACWLGIGVLYPSGGRYPFAWWTLLIVVAVSGCGFALALRSPSARLMAAFFALWLASCVVLYLVPTPMGEIITRLRYIVFPLVLLTVLLGGSRPRWLAVLTLAGAAAYNVAPYAASLTVRIRGDANASQQAYWQPTIDFLARHGSPDHLTEVVATGAHWEAYYLPKDGIPLVRGWYRQIDVVRNDVLYDRSATPAAYLAWLHDNAVRYVVLPDVRLDPHTGHREARLVRDPATGLVTVLRTDDVTIYEVPDATPLLSGPADADVTELTHEEVRGVVGGPGTYELRLNWSPYWRVLDGQVTLHEDQPGATVAVRADQPGPFRIAVRVGPFPR